MRIYRDTRFSSDKTPYKARVAMICPVPGGKRMQSPAFGLQFDWRTVGLIAEDCAFSPEQLSAYREALGDNDGASAVRTAIGEIDASGRGSRRSQRRSSALESRLGSRSVGKKGLRLHFLEKLLAVDALQNLPSPASRERSRSERERWTVTRLARPRLRILARSTVLN